MVSKSDLQDLTHCFVRFPGHRKPYKVVVERILDGPADGEFRVKVKFSNGGREVFHHQHLYLTWEEAEKACTA